LFAYFSLSLSFKLLAGFTLLHYITFSDLLRSLFSDILSAALRSNNFQDDPSSSVERQPINMPEETKKNYSRRGFQPRQQAEELNASLRRSGRKPLHCNGMGAGRVRQKLINA
jgi:hypothetical protein